MLQISPGSLGPANIAPGLLPDVTDGGPAGGPAAFSALEAPLASLRGRRFYATYHGGKYRACVALQPGDDLKTLGLATWRLLGGEYERRKLTDWQNHIENIAVTFDAMAAEAELDPSRPSIEFYRSSRELVLLLPVRN